MLLQIAAMRRPSVAQRVINMRGRWREFECIDSISEALGGRDGCGGRFSCH